MQNFLHCSFHAESLPLMHWWHCNIKPGYSTPWKEQESWKNVQNKMNRNTHRLHIPATTSFSKYLEWLLAGTVFIKPHSSEIFFFLHQTIYISNKNGKIWNFSFDQNNWESLNKYPIHSPWTIKWLSPSLSSSHMGHMELPLHWTFK